MGLKPVTRALLAAVLAIEVSACVTTETDRDDNGVFVEIVERSRQARPAWTQMRKGQLHRANAGGFQFIDMHARQLSLPLALKDAQLKAVDSSRAAVERQLLTLSEEQAAKASVSLQKSQGQLGALAAKAVRSAHEKHARVVDLFYEKLVHDQPVTNSGVRESYRIYVLIQVPKAEWDEAVSDYAAKLVSSPDPSLRKVGQLLKLDAAQGQAKALKETEPEATL